VVEALKAPAGLDPGILAFLAERTKAPEALEVTALAGDASTRRYFRVKEGGRSTILAVQPEPFVPEEMPFLVVQRLLDEWGLPVPAVLAWDGRRGIVLQEDLGDTTLQDALDRSGERERDALYREALAQLALLHRSAHGAPQKADCFRIAFDVEKLSWELHYFLKHFVEGRRGRDLSVEDRATLSGAFHRLSEEIASWPRVLCHRDFHSRNLMVHEGRLRWVDFQDARMGPATYDVASLLHDSYVDLPEELVADRLEEFRQQALPGEARQVLRRRFDLTCAQRNLKALGTFGFMAVVRGNPVYDRYVPRTLALARRNLARHPELEPIHRVLAKHIEELT
jgi:aminoglycoside/choline kinase family phosphotransferase